MKQFLILFFLLVTKGSFACGGDYYGWMDFYTIFDQQNISHQSYKPFLRDESNRFYYEYYEYSDSDDGYPKMVFNAGNLKLWNTLLAEWTQKDIETAVYNPKNFNWKGKKGKILKRAKIYIDYANFCSNMFSHRKAMNSWNYDKIIEQNEIEDFAKVLAKGNELFNKETDEQLKSRYGYQIIRLLHYSKRWKDALRFYNAKVKGKFPANEIYYYTIDQVAGCYYSLKNYETAAYLFSNVVSHSEDRKKSAFNSFDFCVNNDFDGKSLIKTLDDKKDYQFIKSLKGFSDEIKSLTDFINLDANDTRIEVLFVRSINKLESQMLTKNYGLTDKTIPYFEAGNNLNKLLAISAKQSSNNKVSNQDFWLLTNSYLLFLKQDLTSAKSQLNKIEGFTEQKGKLAVIYEVFGWDVITPENEAYLTTSLKQFPKNENAYGIENDFQNIILDYVAHKYYKHNEIAKSFLVHNFIERAADISSLTLIDDLERFYTKPNKSEFEKTLVNNIREKHNFLDYINQLKGVYYLHHFDPDMALSFFNEITVTNNDVMIPSSIFSNNTAECFNCDAQDVMEDAVYKADVFSFIQPSFNLKELTENLIQLQTMTNDEIEWKAKLANYLLGNYYFNISNTGYYRGVLTNRHDNDYSYFGYNSENYEDGEEIIQNKKGYNLSSVDYYSKNYFGMGMIAANYYQKVIELSSDKELNARCLYLIAKCELNQMYNYKDIKTYTTKIDEYNSVELPISKAFYELKYNYSDTKFHDMIIEECSYFRYYSERF